MLERGRKGRKRRIHLAGAEPAAAAGNPRVHGEREREETWIRSCAIGSLSSY
jgi:hypothetical protein